MMEKDNNKEKLKSSSIDFFKWNIDEKELENQIDNYYTLSPSQSLRKISAILLVFASFLTIILVMFELATAASLLDVLLVLILAFFVYKGKKTAIIIAMIYWTFEKGIRFFEDPAISTLIWWTIFMSVFWKAYQVEKAREVSPKEEKSNDRASKYYCSGCGTKIATNANFCRRCGNKIK